MHTMNDVMETSANCKGEPAAVTKAIVAALCTWAELKEITGLRPGANFLPGLSLGAVYNPHTRKMALTIPAEAAAGGCVTIINSRGRTVYSGRLCDGLAPAAGIAWNGHAAGMYYLVFTDKSMRISRPFVVQ
jgi:hypothetical protein